MLTSRQMPIAEDANDGADDVVGQITFGVFGAAVAAITGVGMQMPTPQTRTHTLKYIK